MKIRASLVLLLFATVGLVVACSAPQQLDSSPAASPTASPPAGAQLAPTNTPVPPTREPTRSPTAPPTEADRPTPTAVMPSDEASIEVITPNGGEVWLEGSTHEILWRSSGIETVDVEAASGGKPWVLAVDVNASSGQLVWEIPVGLISNFGIARSDAMRVRVSGSDYPQVYDESDEPFTVKTPRIEFEPGAEAATVTGTLQSEGSQYRYVLKASGDQTMEIEVSPPQVEVNVWGAEEGSTWQIPTGQKRLRIVSLPATQDYFLTLANPSSDESVRYALDVTIR